MSEFPMIAGLVSAAGVPNFGGATKTGSHRQDLAHSAVKEIMMRQQRERSEVIRTLKSCQNRGEYVPPELILAIEHMAMSEAGVGGGVGDGSMGTNLFVSPTRSGVLPSLENSTQNSPSVNQSKGRSHSSSLRPTSPYSVTTITNTHFTANSTGHTNHLDADLPQPTPADHVDVTIGAIRSGAHPKKTPFEYTAKPMLDAIFAAHRNQDRAEEIRLLLQYLERGQRGEVAFDVSASCRVFRQLGEAYAALGDQASAEHFYFDYYLTADKTGNNSEASRALMLLGKLFQAFGDLDKANEWFYKAMERNRCA